MRMATLTLWYPGGHFFFWPLEAPPDDDDPLEDPLAPLSDDEEDPSPLEPELPDPELPDPEFPDPPTLIPASEARLLSWAMALARPVPLRLLILSMSS